MIAKLVYLYFPVLKDQGHTVLYTQHVSNFTKETIYKISIQSTVQEFFWINNKIN